MKRKKLSTWAAEQAVHYRTALAWVREGKMPVPIERTPGGHIRVIEEPEESEIVLLRREVVLLRKYVKALEALAFPSRKVKLPVG